jgi:hypothetical protein
MSSVLERAVALRLELAKSRKSSHVESTLPEVNLEPLISYLEKTDRELEKVQDKIDRPLQMRIKAGDQRAELLVDALEQTRSLLLDLLKVADEFGQD